MDQGSSDHASPPPILKGDRRVVITGLGSVTPLSLDVANLWTRLVAGESGVGKIELIDTSEYKIHFAGEVWNFNLDDIADARETKRLDRFTQFAVHAGHQAIGDAKIDFDSLDRTRCGVVLGSVIGGLIEIEYQIERMLT